MLIKLRHLISGYVEKRFVSPAMTRFKDLSSEKQRIVKAILRDMVTDLEDLTANITWSSERKREIDD